MQKIKVFLEERIWNVRLAALPKKNAVSLQIYRVITLTAKFFIRNRGALHASALTYYTVLSLVPIIALCFGVAKGYGFDKLLKSKIQQGFAAQEETANRIIQFAENSLERASGGVVAGVGMILLIWTALKLLSNIESSFNEIWGVRQGRSWVRKLSDYLTMLILFPTMLIMLVTSSTFVMAQLQTLAAWLPFTGLWNTVLLVLTNLLPFVLGCIIFTFLYAFIPNTKVKFKAAFIAGTIVGILSILLQFGFLYAQKVLTGYNAIYGSFAAIPFLLIWLQLSWILILLGAQISFAVQNVSVYELLPLNNEKASLDCQAVTSIRIMSELADAFEKEQGPVSLAELAEKLEMPVRLARSAIYDLCACGLAARLQSEAKVSELYQLAVPKEKVTPVFILRRLASHGYAGYRTRCSEKSERIVEELWRAAEHSPENRMPHCTSGAAGHD